MNDLRILRFINRFNVGGISFNVAYLSAYLKLKHETKIIGGVHSADEKSSKYIFDNLNLEIKYIKFLKRSINPILDFFALLNYTFVLIKFRPNIVHSHASKAGLLSRFIPLFYKKNIKYVHTFHGNVFDGYFPTPIRNLILFVERFLAKKTDLIIAISEKQKNDLVYKYKIAPLEKVSVVNLGFDLSPFILNDNYNTEFIKSKFNIQKNDVVITIVGRLVPIKNHMLFLEIIKELKEKTNKKVKALIVGDGSEKKRLIEYCNKYNLKVYNEYYRNSYDVNFTSWRSDIAEIYSITDYILLTSINEGTPVSIIEGMASGKVVLSTNVGGVSDVIINESGFICNSVSSDFVSPILNLINNPNLYNFISNNARESVRSRFHYHTLCQNMALQYLNLLNHKL